MNEKVRNNKIVKRMIEWKTCGYYRFRRLAKRLKVDWEDLLDYIWSERLKSYKDSL